MKVLEHVRGLKLLSSSSSQRVSLSFSALGGRGVEFLHRRRRQTQTQTLFYTQTQTQQLSHTHHNHTSPLPIRPQPPIRRLSRLASRPHIVLFSLHSTLYIPAQHSLASPLRPAPPLIPQPLKIVQTSTIYIQPTSELTLPFRLVSTSFLS